MTQLTRHIYVDDSGNEEHGWIVYGWIDVHPAGWTSALRHILDMRKELHRYLRVYSEYELHTTHIVNGRSAPGIGRPVDRKEFGHLDTKYLKDPALDLTDRSIDPILWKDLGRDIIRAATQAIAASDAISVGSVVRKTAARGSEYSAEKYAVYRWLLRYWDGQARTDGCLGVVTMDGQDVHYRDAHRTLKLSSRRMIEDPWFMDSKKSQLVQMSDIVAFLAFSDANRHRGNVEIQEWYETYLAPSSREGQPLVLTGVDLDSDPT